MLAGLLSYFRTYSLTYIWGIERARTRAQQGGRERERGSRRVRGWEGGRDRERERESELEHKAGSREQR